MKRDAANRKIVAMDCIKSAIFAKRERRATLRFVIDVASLKQSARAVDVNERMWTRWDRSGEVDDDGFWDRCDDDPGDGFGGGVKFWWEGGLE